MLLLQAKKNRDLIENGGELEKTTVDGRTVIQSQPGLEPFPSAQARKEYFKHAYKVPTTRYALACGPVSSIGVVSFACLVDLTADHVCICHSNSSVS